MDYEIINKNTIKIIEALQEKKSYFNEISEKTSITSKNNLIKNLNLLTGKKILIKEKNKSNTYYSLNYSSKLLVSILNLINHLKFDKLPFNAKKAINESIEKLKPKIALLFGSYAKGNYKKDSDIDLVFFDSLEKKEQVEEISKSYGIQLNIVFMSSKELNMKNEALSHVFLTGYPLAGENYFYNEFEE